MPDKVGSLAHAQEALLGEASVPPRSSPSLPDVATVGISVRDVRISYDGEGRRPARRAVENISFDVRSGELVAIVGPSGCGKSTLVNAIGGLLEYEGEITLQGSPVTLGHYQGVGIVFQDSSLFPWKSVLANVAYGLRLRGVPRREAHRAAAEFVGLVGLAGRESSSPHELSGGMQQRVNLARALAIEPDVLLLDEPFAALDAQTREFMQGELLRILAASGRQRAMVFITHQINEALYLADRVIVLSKGPAVVRDVVDVPFARPRPLSLKRSAEFALLEEHVWSLLEVEVHAMWREQTSGS